ncbi:single-stranded DNA-binding protein [Kribbella speibonae]|uniref:Single-stranded DNA-binding protein n=2 Tax=Kribbella speibonae TaxID=1572660 RepID=A0ABY2ADQ7_9ACTN|nr:single-stranded DNA-binding protein [Kribbella speibonae]
MNSAIPQSLCAAPGRFPTSPSRAVHRLEVHPPDPARIGAPSPVTAHLSGRKAPTMSLGDTHLTVLGWIGSDPDFKEIGQTPHTSFRLGSTPRQFDRSLNTFVDKPTTWFTVQCWRGLAQNAFESVRIGQPVIVTGRLRTHEWTDDSGEQHSRVILEAFSVGHDLSRGTTTFTKTPPRSEALTESSPQRAESRPAETTASPYPADEFSTTTLPLAPTAPAAEAA